MVKNRYGSKLREGNQIIIDLTPSNITQKIELALELKKILKKTKNAKILEIGSGEGDLTKYILKYNPSLKIDCLDISKEMIDSSKRTLSKFLDRIKFVNEDVLKYLERIDFKYDIIISAWTFHNFKQKDKKKVFEKIYSDMSKNGKMLLIDKVYPDNKKQSKELLKIQLKRHIYLDNDLRKEIIKHEKQDFQNIYRMDESETIKTLKSIGFKNIKILDRVERDIILVAEKR